METKNCKYPECKNPIIGRRAGSIYCSTTCGNNYRNERNRVNRLSSRDIKNLKAYKHLKQLIAEGVNQMALDDYHNLNIDMETDVYSSNLKGGLIFSLFDIDILLTNKIVKFNNKNHNHETK